MPASLSQAEVLICSRGSGGSLEARMSLLSACWAVGLKAEIVPRVCPNVSEQYEYANARGIRWLVTIEEGKSNLVKVSRYHFMTRLGQVLTILGMLILSW